MFRDHREFFLVYRLTDDDGLKAALRWRYMFKRFDPETSTEYSPADIAALDAKQAADKAIKDRLTTKPLTTEQIQALMNTAVGLRATAMEEDRARVWWVPLVAAALAFVGTIVGTWLTAFLGVRR